MDDEDTPPFAKVARECYGMNRLPTDAQLKVPDVTKKSWTLTLTGNLDGFRVCVNMTKQAYWVYGGKIDRRNFTWAMYDGPDKAWDGVIQALSNPVAAGVQDAIDAPRLGA